MEGTSLFIWGMVFGVIGLGFFTYGKKQMAMVPLFTGIALFVFPYFISNVYIYFGGATIFCENMRRVQAL